VEEGVIGSGARTFDLPSALKHRGSLLVRGGLGLHPPLFEGLAPGRVSGPKGW